MRFDRDGLWWVDPVQVKSGPGARAPIYRNIPPPDTGWVPHRDLPNLAGAAVLGLDTETHDEELSAGRGPGAVRGLTDLVGVSVAVPGKAWYFPLGHQYDPQQGSNRDAGPVLAWLQDTVNSCQSVVGANLMYDLEVLRVKGVRVPKHVALHDVQFAEPLIDETAYSYDLDVLAKQYVGQGKETDQLYQWIADSFGNIKEPRRDIWRSPPSLVGPYAEADALLPLDILVKQKVKLEAEDLWDLYRMECGLIPMLLAMRFQGVPIDVARAEQAAVWLREQVAVAQAKVPGIDAWAQQTIAPAFDAAGIDYPRTAAGNASFPKLFLESVAEEHPLAQAILDIRLYDKAANPFVEQYLLANHLNGRIHCQFNPLRSRDYGTVSGRFSSSNPNLQNIPARHAVIAALLRGLFIPEPGCRWRKYDYSQIEYRGLAHYAVGRRADDLREQYNTNPKTDFHDNTIAMVQHYTDITLDRRPAKNINFGLTYGMGEDKLIRSLGVGQDLGRRLYAAYHQAMPMVKATYDSADRLARRRGYIKTILKRRRRFKNGEGTHAALNALLQGTAADIIKKAMHDIWGSGVCDFIEVPYLTVHDELDWNDPGTPQTDAAFKEVEHILENCVRLRVPLLVDKTIGANWGQCG